MGNCGSKRYSQEEVDKIIKAAIAFGSILSLKQQMESNQQLKFDFTLSPPLPITWTSGALPSTTPASPATAGV
jgi:hypothetical protein